MTGLVRSASRERLRRAPSAASRAGDRAGPFVSGSSGEAIVSPCSVATSVTVSGALVSSARSSRASAAARRSGRSSNSVCSAKTSLQQRAQSQRPRARAAADAPARSRLFGASPVDARRDSGRARRTRRARRRPRRARAGASSCQLALGDERGRSAAGSSRAGVCARPRWEPSSSSTSAPARDVGVQQVRSRLRRTRRGRPPVVGTIRSNAWSRRVRPRGRRSCPAQPQLQRLGDGGGDAGKQLGGLRGVAFGALRAEPAFAVGAHVVDDRQQRPALLGQRVLDARRHLAGRCGARRSPPPPARAGAARACAG